MKNLKIYAMLLAGVATLSSCSDDLLGSKGEGWIQLSGVSTDKGLSTETRAGEPVMAVDIVDGDGNTFVHADDWTTIQGESYLVKAGNTYTVKAYTAGGDAEAEGFDVAPYYEGSSDVTVKANQAQTVDVTCRLAQAKLSVNYCADWKRFVQEGFFAEVVGTDVRFEGEESRAAYLKAGRELKLRLIFTPVGKTYANTLEKTIVADTKAATHYKVNVNLNTDGNGNITVDVDETIHEYEVTLGVPVENNGIITAPINGDYSRVWGTSATLSGFVNEETGDPVQFMYAPSGTENWTTVDAGKVGETAEFAAEITGLQMGTAYDYKIVSGEMAGDVLTFTTEKYEEIPNLDFENWAQKGKTWYPNAVAAGNTEAGAYWSTGNEGVTSTMAGGNDPITTPVEDSRPGSAGTKCAEMHTITGVMLVGSASGNLFIGKYKTNFSKPAASVTFGRPYSGARPRKLSGWYKYSPKPINNGSYDEGRGITTDEANIYLKVWAADGSEIGYGEMVDGENVTEWKQFSFDVTYTDTTKPAATITIVATSSHYGGVFEGSSVIGKVGAGSQLWVDDFEIGY
ncbi:MAG: PCMD domain-containing protein [Bacteroidaceae bacterium]|nr:PCMD domain-containing protein [Bacteroidaceae bacterium]